MESEHSSDSFDSDLSSNLMEHPPSSDSEASISAVFEHRTEFFSDVRCLGNLIGRDGRFKRFLEHRYGLRITITEGGSVILRFLKPIEPNLIRRFEMFLYAIRLGFQGSQALRCLDLRTENGIVTISLDTFRRRARRRAKAPVHLRVVGKRGRTKALIEQRSLTSLRVTPRFIHIIG